MVPLVGFLPADDERVRGTVAAIEENLLEDGFVQRYTQPRGDRRGRPARRRGRVPGLHVLAGRQLRPERGRHDEARELFERLLALRNDVGLLSEEYDPKAGRLVGNFPQAFSHVPLIDTARNLSSTLGPSQERQREGIREPEPAAGRR